MANPQIEDGYTKIANDIMDALIAANLSGQEMRVALFVIRKTYGFNKTEDYISLSQIMKALGILKVRASQVVTSIVLMKILTVTENINGLTKKYKFNKNFDEWDTVNKNINRKGKTKQTVNVLRNRPLMKTLTTKDTITKDTITKDKSMSVFVFWNESGLIKHSDFSKHEPAIRSAFKHNSKDDIEAAIKNYATVINDPDCFWTYRWTLKDFLNRGLDRFLPVNFQHDDFLSRGNNGNGGKPELPQPKPRKVLGNVKCPCCGKSVFELDMTEDGMCQKCFIELSNSRNTSVMNKIKSLTEAY